MAERNQFIWRPVVPVEKLDCARFDMDEVSPADTPWAADDGSVELRHLLHPYFDLGEGRQHTLLPFLVRRSATSTVAVSTCSGDVAGVIGAAISFGN